MVRRLRGTVSADPIWIETSFARQVDAVRRQLRPIRTRRALAASFEREAFHVRRSALEAAPALGPVRVAYAVRWMELGDGEPRPAWPGLPYSTRSSSR